MEAEDMQPGQWYWIRRQDGSLAPYQFHRLHRDDSRGTSASRRIVAQFYVGSMLTDWPLSRVVALAQMPDK